jgi:hypothetical protein
MQYLPPIVRHIAEQVETATDGEYPAAQFIDLEWFENLAPGTGVYQWIEDSERTVWQDWANVGDGSAAERAEFEARSAIYIAAAVLVKADPARWLTDPNCPPLSPVFVARFTECGR